MCFILFVLFVCLFVGVVFCFCFFCFFLLFFFGGGRLADIIIIILKTKAVKHTCIIHKLTAVFVVQIFGEMGSSLDEPIQTV